MAIRTLFTSLLLLTTACGWGDPETPRQFSELQKNFQYVAGGGGFDADDNLVLVGQSTGSSDSPGETIRWNRNRSEFERFGGPLPVSDGLFLRDGAGRLHLVSGSRVFTFGPGESAWRELSMPPGFGQPATERLYSLQQAAVDRAGNFYGQFKTLGPTPPEGGPTPEGIAILKRAPGASGFTPLFEAPSDRQGRVTVNGQLVYLRYMAVRGDGTVFLSADEALFALPPGGGAFVNAFDCRTVVGKYCTNPSPVFTNPRSDEALIPGYRIPRGTAFPVVPQELEALAPTAGFRVGADGTLWSYVTEKDGRTVDYPPYILDVTSVRRLSGTKWELVVTFDTPSFSWLHSDHDAFYSYGRQLAAGGIWTSWGVYSLKR